MHQQDMEEQPMYREMTTVRGKVLQTDGRRATIEVEPAITCQRCATGKGCGAGLLGGNSGPKTIAIDVTSRDRIVAGDAVSLSIAPMRLLHASLLAYGLPLAGALTGLLIGQVFLNPVTDLKGAGLALCGLVGGFLVGQRRLRSLSCMQQFVPEMTGRPNAH